LFTATAVIPEDDRKTVNVPVSAFKDGEGVALKSFLQGGEPSIQKYTFQGGNGTFTFAGYEGIPLAKVLLFVCVLLEEEVAPGKSVRLEATASSKDSGHNGFNMTVVLEMPIRPRPVSKGGTTGSAGSGRAFERVPGVCGNQYQIVLARG
jgi:hypothetical protein